VYSLTFRVRVTNTYTPAVWTEWNGTRSRRVDFIAGEGDFAGMRSAWRCVRRAVGLADYRWALPLTSSVVVVATQPVHRLQIRPIMHNYSGIDREFVTSAKNREF